MIGQLKAVAFAAALSACLAAAGQAADVPFVGCPADGQSGPQAAPTSAYKTVSLNQEEAKRFAFYQSRYDKGVLAPRGGHCAAVYGSSGARLLIVPQMIAPKDLLAPDFKSLRGPAVELSISYGDTSGRFDVARGIARYFPDRTGFLQSVIAEKIEPASAFPAGLYPSDHVLARKTDWIEVSTPAGAKGQGADNWLAPDTQPILSVVQLQTASSGDGLNLAEVTVRLAPGDQEMAAAIAQSAFSPGGRPK